MHILRLSLALLLIASPAAFAQEPALGPFGIAGPRRHEFSFTVRIRD